MVTSRKQIRKPSRPAPADQAKWNAQLGSSMPVHRYKPYAELVEKVSVPDRSWPDKVITKASEVVDSPTPA